MEVIGYGSYCNLDTEECLEDKEGWWDDYACTSIHEDGQEEKEEKLNDCGSMQEDTEIVVDWGESLSDYVYRYNQLTMKEAQEGISIDYRNIQPIER